MKYFRIFLLSSIITFLIIVSCQPGRNIAGKYQEENPLDQDVLVVLSLTSDGKGSWSVDDETVSFKWKVHDDEIWLHTPSGGVIVGKLLQTDSIIVTLPGIKKIFLKKIRQ
ncbi:MAG: hypothetical protein JW786_05095 [Desulfobacterales bacterium]|nr:hypothetical protein [Desulfobacterales bacterium]